MNYDLLESYLNTEDISWRKLSADTGVSKSTLQRSVKNKHLTIDVFEAICKSQNWPMVQFLDESAKKTGSSPAKVLLNKMKRKLAELDKLTLETNNKLAEVRKEIEKLSL